ncbi:hypothetical protein J3R83DRAFT_1434 [Lanmaoa asiatica]|nr:hypothetical protein J3R83DRAFT_1434 [Lanmaoa asiatica]
MCDDHSNQRENTPDPLGWGLTHPSLFSAEFIAQLLIDFPDVLSTPIITTSPSPPPIVSASESASASTFTSAPFHTPHPHFTCQWVSPHDHPLVCGVPLSQDPKHVCHHFRHAHDIRGNGKVHVLCHWRDCDAPPMLRGSLIRHVLTVHLRLLRWQCEVCGKVFSRTGTRHTCVEDFVFVQYMCRSILCGVARMQVSGYSSKKGKENIYNSILEATVCTL